MSFELPVELSAPSEVLAPTIPILSPSDIKHQSGFDYASNPEQMKQLSKDLFIQSIAASLKDPDIEKYFSSTLATSISSEPALMPIRLEKSKKDREIVRKMIEASPNEQLEFAKSLEVGAGGISRIGQSVLVGRALRHMSEAFPNLMFFRGTSHDPKEGFTGRDFSPGDFSPTLKWAEKDFYDSRRQDPIVTMISFADVSGLVEEGKLQLNMDHNWWRASLHLQFLEPDDAKKSVTIRKLPVELDEERSIKDKYTSTSISRAELDRKIANISASTVQK